MAEGLYENASNFEALANLTVCHPERSEGSASVVQKQILRFAQDDRIKEADSCKILFVFISRTLKILKAYPARFILQQYILLHITLF